MRNERDFTRRAFLKKSMALAISAGAASTLAPFLGNRPGICLEEAVAGAAASSAGNPLPNIIIINADDLGYGDIECYGGTAIRTPSLSRLANEGIRFTDFCSCNAVCTPSRFGLLTGRYPQRPGLYYVLFPEKRLFRRRLDLFLARIGSPLEIVDMGAYSKVDGIPDDEITIAEALKGVGYRTGMVGKWHLGDFVEKPEYNPLNHGFDSYFGVPYSNDMYPFPLCRDREVVEAQVGDQSKLTGLYTKEAIDFIEKSPNQPFFFYFAHTFPHQPLYASQDFFGKSDAGRYGDAVEEVDWSVGQIMACLDRNGLADNTLIFFTSDNGPWYNGSPGGLRGRKGQSFEGGFRVPLIARWPGHISPGSLCTQPSMNIDLFPTCLSVADAELPSDRIIDGKNILGLLTGEATESPHEKLFFYHHEELEAVRAGKWKYYRNINTYVSPKPLDKKIRAAGKGPPWLYDLEKDPGESYNLYSNFPEVGKKLSGMMDEWEKNLENNPKGWTNR